LGYTTESKAGSFGYIIVPKVVGFVLKESKALRKWLKDPKLEALATLEYQSWKH